VQHLPRPSLPWRGRNSVDVEAEAEEEAEAAVAKVKASACARGKRSRDQPLETVNMSPDLPIEEITAGTARIKHEESKQTPRRSECRSAS
jgi:hypothetical protein